MERNVKKCVICGKDFFCPPSTNKVTCSAECRKLYAKKRSTGRVFTEEAKKKISEKAKGRDMRKLQKLATDAALKSPKSGRFETNINAVDWHIVAPNGTHYQFHCLSVWLRENCRELFGCEPDSREFKNVRSGLSGAKSAAIGKGSYSCPTYKGWRVIPTDDDRKKLYKDIFKQV